MSDTLKIQMPDGQEFELPANVAGNDKDLRAALSDAYPDAATATFDRKTSGIVKVVKKAGTKGALETLAGAPAHINPALAMRWRLAPVLADADVSQKLLEMRAEIEAAAEAGRADVRAAERAHRVLRDAEPVAARRVPVGF